MSSKLNELQDEYEKEFSEFLIQKINHAGGSLQFQHLSGLLQQLRFEIRDAFGVTKSEFMKFLKAHSITFNLNSKGVVTVASSTTLNSSSYTNEGNSQNTIVEKTFLPKIKNGKGLIFKVFPGYAIIKAERPVETYVFFTPLEYGADKDSLFIDFDLHIQTEVCFNAIYGHSDYEIKYRATKVWILNDSDDENCKRDKIIKINKFTGEGIIKKLYPNVGFISVTDKKNETVFFYRTRFKDHNIKLGDHVEFVAEYDSKEWQVTEIIKKRKESAKERSINEPSAHYERCTKTVDKHKVSSDRIKNESGKIYPYSKGAIIKFGKKYSELADGNSCSFYLYEIKVENSDIAVEFSEGDDVKFDAVKSKNSPEWKAVLVWVGEKPAIADYDKEIDENSEDLNNTDPNEIASNISSEVSDLLLRTIKSNNNKENNTTNKRCKLNNKSKVCHDNPISRNLNRFSEEYHENSIAASEMFPQKLSHKKSKYNRSKNIHSNKKFVNKYNPRQSFPKLTKIEINDEINENLSILKNSYLDISESSETTSEENDELQDSPHSSRKFLIEDKQHSINRSKLKKNLKTETDSDKESDKVTSENKKTVAKVKSSIKQFEAIDGEIIEVLCKFAIIKSDHLEKEVDFFLNSFYLNGKSVEEQQVTNLKEVIKVGDIIKMNCFEIIDDSGAIYQKVTTAWKGLEPNVYEIKPDEFILEHELSVSVDNELDYECELEKSFDATRSTNLNKICKFNSEVDSSLYSSHDDISHEYSVVSNSKIDNIDEHLSSDVQQKKLQERILKRLETYDAISSEPEVALNVVQDIINIVLKNFNIEESFNSSVYQDSAIKSDSVTVCSSCEKTKEPFIEEVVKTKDSESQTVITGEIAHTSIFTEDW